MHATLDLYPAPLEDVAIEGDGPLAAMRATGPAPRAKLMAADGQAFSLSPGEYVIELEIRSEGDLAPALECATLGGPAHRVALTRTSADSWRAEATFGQTVTGFSLALGPGESRFLVTRCRIATDTPAPAPRVRDAMLQALRAVYQKLPRSVRRTLGRAAMEIRGVSKLRAASVDHSEHAGGSIRLSSGSADAAELEARRADFDARFAAARGIREPAATIDAPAVGSDVRVIAFHLPQYHRIAENDAWWGAGFTDWTNVAKATPQFVGHHQPRLPGELGFYDLTAPEALGRQVALAKEYGVSAFCFHYYWFGGRRLLERPLDAFLADASLDLGFTLCWANENWTRRWDGAEDTVLIAQQHSTEDHARVFEDMARYLEDPRALRIAGKPLILVYRPALIADARAMTEIWRERAHARGWPGLYLAATDAFQFEEPSKLGFDGLVEFPPHGLSPPRIEKRLAWLNPAHRGAVFDYAAAAEEALARLRRRQNAPYDVFPGVMPGWDNEARRPGAGNVFHGATPQAYARWLAAACQTAQRALPADRRLVFVNAWNEWAEGAYLEPDRKWGRAYLEATAHVIGATPRRVGSALDSDASAHVRS